MTSLRVPLYPLEKATKPVVCCVTGATGYVASAIVQRLLIAGHTVHATVRNPSDTSKVSHLTSLYGTNERLKLFKADLIDSGSFDEAIKDCKYVFHVASPFVLGVPKSQVDEKLVKPAVKGVENVFDAVNRVGSSVEAIVMTSSVVAMHGDNWDMGKDHVWTEADWNESSNPGFLPYSYSKTLAEKRAWELANPQKRWTLKTINPGFVLGPPLKLSCPGESVNFCLDMIRGKFKAGLPNVCLSAVDVDDVAAAHILAALNPNASGRFLCAALSTNFRDLVADAAKESGVPVSSWMGMSPPRALLWIISNVFRMIPWDLVTSSLNKPFKIDNSKIQNELGLQFINPSKSLADMADAVKALEKP